MPVMKWRTSAVQRATESKNGAELFGGPIIRGGWNGLIPFQPLNNYFTRSMRMAQS